MRKLKAHGRAQTNTTIPSIFIFPWNNVFILESLKNHLESHSNQRLFHPTKEACSIATMAIHNSAWTADLIPIKNEKQPRNTPKLSLKIPPLAAWPGDPLDAPISVTFDIATWKAVPIYLFNLDNFWRFQIHHEILQKRKIINWIWSYSLW